jgi:hypothetical protein
MRRTTKTRRASSALVNPNPSGGRCPPCAGMYLATLDIYYLSDERNPAIAIAIAIDFDPDPDPDPDSDSDRFRRMVGNAHPTPGCILRSWCGGQCPPYTGFLRLWVVGSAHPTPPIGKIEEPPEQHIPRNPETLAYNPYSPLNFSIIDFRRRGCMVLYKDSGTHHAICV